MRQSPEKSVGQGKLVSACTAVATLLQRVVNSLADAPEHLARRLQNHTDVWVKRGVLCQYGRICDDQAIWEKLGASNPAKGIPADTIRKAFDKKLFVIRDDFALEKVIDVLASHGVRVEIHGTPDLNAMDPKTWVAISSLAQFDPWQPRVCYPTPRQALALIAYRLVQNRVIPQELCNMPIWTSGKPDTIIYCRDYSIEVQAIPDVVQKTYAQRQRILDEMRRIMQGS